MSVLNLTTGQVTTSYPPAPSRAATCDNPALSTAKTLSDAELLAGFKAQFSYFYGQAAGYFPIDEGIRDDEAPTGIQMLLPTEGRPDIPNRRVWCYYDPERPDLLDSAAEVALEKAKRSGNVYLTRALAQRKSAKKESALPSRIIAVEDAPAQLPIPASRVLRTSPASRQAFYRLTEPVSNARAERLSKLIARVVGSDRSGTNSNKVLRLVGGLNTKGKYGTPYRVNVESRGRDYTYDELWSTYSALAPAEALVEAEAQRDRAAVRWPEAKERWVEHWRKHIGQLMDGKTPRVFKLATHSQGYKIFCDEAYIAGWRHESGSWDASTVRHVRASNLIRAGLSDEMIAAVVEVAELPETLRAKGLNAVRNDIRQVVTMAREREILKSGPRAGACGYALVGDYARRLQPEFDIPAEGQAAEEPHVGGRPASLTAEALLAFYQEHAACNVVTMTRAEVAEALHVSPATVYRLNSELKTRREIAVELVDQRQRSLIRLTRLVKTSALAGDVMTRAEETLQRVETPQTADCDPQAVLVTHVVLNPALGDASARVAAPPATSEKLSAPNEESGGRAAAGETAHNVRSSQSTLQPPPALVDAPRTIDLTRDEAREQEERERPQARARSTVYDIVKQELAARTVEKRNPKTGALYRGRAPFKPILEAVRAQFPNVREDIVRTVYERLMRPIRREMRQDSQTLAAMGYSDQEVYRRLERARAMLRVAGNPAPQARPGEAPEKHAERVARWENVKRLEWKHLRDAERYVAELERRGLSTEPPPARQRTRREVLQQMEMLTVVPSQDELFTRLAAEPLPTTRAALWEMLERICAARGIDVPAETFTLEELAERVERLRRLAIVA